MGSDIADWTITFADTGWSRRSASGCGGCANTSVTSRTSWPTTPTCSPSTSGQMIERPCPAGALASMLVVPPQSSFHCVNVTSTGEVKEVMPLNEFSVGVNGGYFVLHQDVIDLIPENGDLVGDACESLAGTGKLIGYRHDGFWKPADTFKERAELDTDYNNGFRPWALWERAGRWRDRRRRSDDPRCVRSGGGRCALRRHRHRGRRDAAADDPAQSGARRARPGADRAGTDREIEEKNAFAALCGAARGRLTVADLPDGHLPRHWGEVKTASPSSARTCEPDLVLGPQRRRRPPGSPAARRNDAHRVP